MEDSILRSGEPVVGVRLQGGQLPGQAREVAGRVPRYVLRILRAHLRAEPPPPPGPLYALLGPWGIGVGLCLCPLRLLLDCLRRFSRLSEGLQLRLKSRRPLLCHLTACTFGAEFFPDLSQLAHK